MSNNPTLQQKAHDLMKAGYHVTIPAGANYICVMGYGNGYFKAKNTAANRITAELNRKGYLAWNKKDVDGYHDFYCK